MSGRNLNVYLSEETYQKLEPLIKQRKVSKFIQEAIEEKLVREAEEKNNEIEKTKCPQCLKLTPETETDNCDKCDKKFCQECLTYYEELAFCRKCK